MMSYDMLDNNKGRAHGALAITQHAREQEGQRWFLQAEYSPRQNEAHKSVRKGLAALLTGLFGLFL